MFSATHSLKGLSCLNSPGTPQRHSADLRRQPNFAEKSVIAAISCVEQRSFKIPQLPALRTVVNEPAQQKHRFVLLLYSQSIGSPSILGENVFQQPPMTCVTRCRQGLQACFGGMDTTSAPFTPHSGPHGQTEECCLRSVLLPLRPRKVGPGFRMELPPAIAGDDAFPAERWGAFGIVRPKSCKNSFYSPETMVL